MYVLRELGSAAGDANHRLAAHGLRALRRHLAAVGLGGATIAPGDDSPPAPSFVAADPKLFRSALMKFSEVSPWFAFPNAVANAAVLQTLAIDPARSRTTLHVVDIGVSHGIQWPTLLEALTRQHGGPPAIVRLTVAGAGAAPPCPFSSAPIGYDFPSHLLRYAKSIGLNLQIKHAADLADVKRSPAGDEILVVSSQFRTRYGSAGDRSAFLGSIRRLDPDLLVLAETDAPSSGAAAAGFSEAFARGAEVMWAFLDSTSAAFKGSDCPQRRLVEGEAARMLEEETAVAEGKEAWRERMRGLGFRQEGFGGDATDAGKALLRKYDGNWEMRAGDAAVGLAWKGRPVSNCTLWRPFAGAGELDDGPPAPEMTTTTKK